MQKVIQRTQRAERVVAKQKKKFIKHKEGGEGWERNQNRMRVLRATHEQIRQDRRDRKADWELGSLAPRRDVGEQEKTYGALSMYNFHMADKDPKDRPKWWHIAEGDRVAVTRGREKGRIGVVSGVHEDKATVTIKDVNVVSVHVPEWMKKQNNAQEDLVTTPRMVPLEDVRLVYPLPDPETGVPRDVIIDRLVCRNRKRDRNTRKYDEGDRVIPGTNTIIPWPEKADPEYEDNEVDTLRISVEEITFRPFLMRPPMPLSVIDELRGKYSRFRTRHDDDYRTQKELEDAKVEDRKELINTMRTPLQELAELRAQQKKAQEKELTDEQLARIGEVIAQEQVKATQAVKAVQS